MAIDRLPERPKEEQGCQRETEAQAQMKVVGREREGERKEGQRDNLEGGEQVEGGGPVFTQGKEVSLGGFRFPLGAVSLVLQGVLGWRQNFKAGPRTSLYLILSLRDGETLARNDSSLVSGSGECAGLPTIGAAPFHGQPASGGEGSWPLGRGDTGTSTEGESQLWTPALLCKPQIPTA